MNWIYSNNTDHSVFFHNYSWRPGDTLETQTPVPASLGLTCIQEGTSPDPVLVHQDVTVQAGASIDIDIHEPLISQNVYLSILCMTNSTGVQCRFNSALNKPIPIDKRGFVQKLSWPLCSKVILDNPTDSDAIISVTAVEVVD